MKYVPVLLMVVLAGCAASEPVDDAEPEPEPEMPLEYAVPDDIRATVRMPLGYQWQCIQPCPTFPFTLEGNTTVDASMTWLVAANDHDFKIFSASGEEMTCGCDVVPATREHVVIDLAMGDYTLVLLPYESTPEDVTLAVTFKVAEE